MCRSQVRINANKLDPVAAPDRKPSLVESQNMRPLLVLIAGGLLLNCGGQRKLSPCDGTSMRTAKGLASSAAGVACEGAPIAESDLAFLRTFIETRGFSLGRPVAPTPAPDGKAVLFLRASPRDARQSVYELNRATGIVRELLSPENVTKSAEVLSPTELARRERMRIAGAGFTSFELSNDGRNVLLSLGGRLFVLTRDSGNVRELPTGHECTDPHFSPDGTRVGYVRGADVYMVGTASGAEIALTHGGTELRPHGVAEFIAQEEFGRSRGYWWSPDGSVLLYEEVDNTKVDELSIADPAHPDKEPTRVRYPRPGRTNADTRFGFTSVGGGPTTWIVWDRARFPYVATVGWQPNAPPTLFVLNRAQTRGMLLAADPKTGKTTTLLEEQDDTWVNLEAYALARSQREPVMPRWLPNGEGFFWMSDRRGDLRLELRDRKGNWVRELTAPQVGYREFLTFDPARRVAYVLASSDPTEQALVGISIDDGRADIVLGGPGRYISAWFGKSHEVFVASEASLTKDDRLMVRSVDRPVERELPSEAQTLPFLPKVELARVGRDNVRVAIVRPRKFDGAKRYPIIDSAYGFPGVNLATNRLRGYLRAQWIADVTDSVVVSIDSRGTSHRGRDWERAMKKRFGIVAVEGHVETIAALSRLHPEFDSSRVGVYGWSGGGYFAALAVLTRPDVYKVAVAGAPTADQRDYDSAATERFLGSPEEESASYEAASLLTYALRKPDSSHPSRPLLVIHGTADDNVFFVHSLKLVDALERGGRPFELMPLLGSTHMVTDPGQLEALWIRTATFLRDHLARP